MAVERYSGSEQPDESQKKTKPVVLVIHQGPAVVDACRASLEKHGYDVITAQDGNEGIQTIYQAIPDVIVAGSAVPELNGYQICRLLKSDPVMKKIPVLLLADMAEKMDRFWGVKAGADDFLQSDEISTKLLKKIGMVLEIYERMGIQEKKLLQENNARNPFNIRTRLNHILDTSLVESTLMVEFRSLSDLIHDVSLLNYMLFSLLESILEYDAAAIFYNDDNKGPRMVTFHLPEGKKQSPLTIERMMDAFFAPLKARGALTETQLELQESEVIGTLEEGEGQTEPADYDTVYTKEVHVDGRLIGCFSLYSAQKVDYSKIFPIHLIEDEVRLLMKLRHLYSQAERLAVTDSLTGLFNHRHFMTVLQREFKSAKRYELELAMGMITIDNFKQLNDEWGHLCGDDILKHVARLADKHFRNVDIVARFGGKQLVVLFPNTPAKQAVIALERFQKVVTENPAQCQDARLDLTVSCGLTSLEQAAEGVSDFIKQGEEALRQARTQGANRIEISKA